MRELNKCLVGFQSEPSIDASECDTDVGDDILETGLWGCGAFGGDPEVKAIIQYLAAVKSGRSCLKYFTHGSMDEGTQKDIVIMLRGSRALQNKFLYLI